MPCGWMEIANDRCQKIYDDNSDALESLEHFLSHPVLKIVYWECCKFNARMEYIQDINDYYPKSVTWED